MVVSELFLGFVTLSIAFLVLKVFRSRRETKGLATPRSSQVLESTRANTMESCGKKEVEKKLFVNHRSNRIFSEVHGPTGGLYPFLISPKFKVYPVSSSRSGDRGAILQGFLYSKLCDRLPKHWKVLMNQQIGDYKLNIAITNQRENLSFALSVEIDEPYESIDLVRERKPKDWMGCHTMRDIGLSMKGWTTLRFAEVQIARQPQDCVNYILAVLEAGENDRNVDTAELKVEKYFRWSQDVAFIWSYERYREEYLDKVDLGDPPVVFEEPFALEVMLD